MNYRLCTSLLALLLCASCATTGNVENRTGRLLCMQNEEAGAARDCLSALNARPEEVDSRVALFNEGKTEDRKIQCRKRKEIGSNVAKWRCFRINRAGNELDIPLGTLELLRKNNNRSQ